MIDNHLESIGQYKILHEINFGFSAKVYACANERGEPFAIKLYNTQKFNESQQQQEVSLLNKLKHENIMKAFNLQDNMLVMELLDEELYEYISIPQKGLPKDIARFYFNQLMNAVYYMHQNHIAHRDLKLENLMLDKDLNLKIIDFGFATEYEHGKPLRQLVGSERYLSPEVVKGQAYNPEKVDVFACGVILFTILFGFPPFYKVASPFDPYYKFFFENKKQQYWNILKRKFNLDVDPILEDLLSGLLEQDPMQRLTIQQIVGHQWFQVTSELSYEQRIEEMNKRKIMIKRQKQSLHENSETESN